MWLIKGDLFVVIDDGKLRIDAHVPWRTGVNVYLLLEISSINRNVRCIA